MVHYISGKARCRIRMAITALDAGRRNMRWALHPQCDATVMTARAIRIAGPMNVGTTRPTREAGCRSYVARCAIPSIRCHVIWV
jgi:hypothetical protein